MAIKMRFDNMDASESAFFSNQLTHVRSAAYMVQFPALKGREFVPKVTDAIHPGAEVYEYRSYTETGKAIIGRDYSTDAPRADLYGASSTEHIFGIRDGYGYSIQEARAAQMAGLPLAAAKAKAARSVMETQLDTAIWDGHTSLGLAGIASLSSTCTYTTPVGAGGTKDWPSKTSDEVVEDLAGMVLQILSDTNEVEMPNTMILPASRYNHIANRRMGDGDSTTILNHFLGINKQITSIESSIKLETAGTASSKRMMAYEKNPDKIGLIIPQEFEQFAPQQRGMEVVTDCHMRYGGIALPYPKSVCYGDYI